VVQSFKKGNPTQVVKDDSPLLHIFDLTLPKMALKLKVLQESFISIPFPL
jgi:hypothetical protein